MRVASADLRFRVMGSDAHLIVVVDGSQALRHARALARRGRRRLRQLERRWSRFRPASEVNRLARRAGRWTTVSADTTGLVARMLDAWHLTDGWFDPTVLPCLQALGYDRSMERIARCARERTARGAPGLDGVDVDAAVGIVRLPVGTALDAGGIGKGLAADVVAEDLRRAGAAGVCVNVGGDLRARGTAPGGDEWRVATPAQVGRDVVVALRSGGVATSSPVGRRWRTQAGVRHHLVVPRTGVPADVGLTSLTVVAPRGWQAEVLATAGAVAGWTVAERLVARVGGHALAWTCDGRGLATERLRGAVA